MKRKLYSRIFPFGNYIFVRRKEWVRCEESIDSDPNYEQTCNKLFW
jgi:hypothetical protein